MAVWSREMEAITATLRGVDGVGGVEPSPQTHLQHHDVALPSGEPVEGKGRDELELRHRVPGGVVGLGDGGQELHLLDHRSCGEIFSPLI